VIEINTAIEDHLEILSQDPWDRGWLIKIRLANKDISKLLDAEGYEALLSSQN
jgi:glycine cleavage system H protein